MNFENAIIIRSKTRLQQLIERFNTQAQAKFYISQSQKQFYTEEAEKAVEEETETETSMKKNKMNKSKATSDFSDYEIEHENYQSVFQKIQKVISKYLKTKIIDQSFLPSYLFTRNDLIIVVGHDGLVANTAKYIKGNPIIAINPNPDRFDGILLPFSEPDYFNGVEKVLSGKYEVTEITMACVKLNDGQKLIAFNDLFIGLSDHASARYKISFKGQTENHSSSGLIISTGAGSTGWLSSLYNMANGIVRFATGKKVIEYSPIPKNADELIFIVREPFQSKTSQINIVAGTITHRDNLIIESYMPNRGVIFSDGVQSDYLKFNSGSIAQIGIAEEKARLVVND